MIAKASIDIDHLQEYLFLNAGFASDDLMHAARANNAIPPQPRRDANTRPSQMGGSGAGKLSKVDGAAHVRNINFQHAPKHDSEQLSFLPSTVPETLRVVHRAERSITAATKRGMEAETASDIPDTQASNATQQLTPSVFEQVIRSRSERTSLRKPSVDEDVQDELPDTLPEENSLEEGDTNFLDIISSFAARSGGHELVPVNFSPTQSQPPLTQFPESQRFKTPATAGKKRDRLGNTIETPAQPRNPFARDGATAGANLLGLSQAFENTQAASSPMPAVPTSELRSDQPSPGIEVRRTIANPLSSPSFRPLSEVKRSLAEPAERYLPIGHSQLSQRDSTGDGDEDLLPTEDAEDSDTQISALIKTRRAKQREARAREQLKCASSPISSPQKHGTTSDLRGTGRRRTESERPSSRRAASISSSPPAIAQQQNEGTTSATQQDQDDGIEETANTRDEHRPTPGAVLALSVMVRKQKTANMVVPDTTKRMTRARTQLPFQIASSPSKHHSVQPELALPAEFTSPDVIRIQNSQRSTTSTQKVPAQAVAPSSGDSIVVVPASQIADETGVLPVQGDTGQPFDNCTEPSGPPVSSGQGEQRLTNGDTAPSLMGKPGAAGTNSASTNSEEPHRNTYATAPTNQEPDGNEHDMSSQPVRAPRGRKHRRMEEISQEEVVPPATQSSSFEAAEFLQLDNDPDVAKALASSADEDPVIPRKRTKWSKAALAPSLEIEESRSLQDSTNANVGRRVSQRDEQPDGIENDNPSDNAQRPHRRTTPSKMPQRKSIWETDESPKASRASLMAQSRSHPMTKMTKKKLPPKRGHNGRVQTPTAPPSTLPSIEEASPDPLSISMSSTAPATPPVATSTIVAPDMVFAYFMDKTRAYYPAKCLGPGSDSQMYLIKWPGYDGDNVRTHGVCSLDLRIGDEVKVSRQGFPKTTCVIRNFGSSPVVSSEDEITDIYGHSTVLLQPKNTNFNFPKGTDRNTPVPVAHIYIDSALWRRMSKRPFVYKAQAVVQHVSRPSTPSHMPSTPTTPSSRSRLSIKGGSVQPARTDGMFSNMAFALSFEDDNARRAVSNLVLENGGRILPNSFRDLVDEKAHIRPSFADTSFAALLASRHSRKEKYMQALALGLPCLSGSWVKACVAKKALIEWRNYLLPAGESTELDNAVKSRDLPAINLTDYKLSAALNGRNRFFKDCDVLFLNGRRKDEIKKRAPHLFFTQVMSAPEVIAVPDLDAAREQLLKSNECRTTWLCVDDKDKEAVLKATEGLSREHSVESKRKSSIAQRDIRVADSEYILQSLIWGQLCSLDQHSYA